MWASQTYAGTLGTKRKFLTEKAMADRREVVKVLLEKGADVNIEANVCTCTFGIRGGGLYVIYEPKGCRPKRVCKSLWRLTPE